MRIQFLLVCLTCLWLHAAQGQSVTGNVDKMVPPTPEVASFVKAGEYPVSYYTGTPNISVPLFTLKEQDLSMPIDLSYDGTAIGVEALPTLVGQGWNLLPGGVITKINVGSATDLGDSANYYQLLPFKDYVHSVIIGKDTCCTYNSVVINWGQVDPWLTTSVPIGFNMNTRSIMDEIVKGTYYQPDIYSFNFLGYSGKFYINPINHQVYSLQQQDKIIFEYLGSINSGWKATLPNGIKVYFSALEHTIPMPSAGDINEADSWKLTSIVLLNGETITFTYTDVSYELYTNADVGHTTYQDDDDLEATYVINTAVLHNFENVYPPYPTDYAMGADLMYSQVFAKYLTKIESQHYVINFNLTSEVKPKLSGISLYNKSNPLLQKKFTFSYADFKCAESGWDTQVKNLLHYSGAAVYQRYKLTALTTSLVQNGTETADEPYAFEYVENVGLPSVMSKAQDYWGYYNGYSQNAVLIPDESRIFSTYSFTNIGHLPEAVLNDLHNHCTARRWVDTAYTAQGMLKKIKYPTKGYTIFNFEPHRFNYPGAHILTKQEYEGLYQGGNDSVSMGAGIRIKDILNYDSDNRFVSRKKFKYGPGEAGIGLLFLPLNFWKMTPAGSCGAGFVAYHSWVGATANTNGSPLIPYTLGYNIASIYESSTESDNATEQLNGKTVHIFHNVPLGFNLPFNYPYLTTLDKRNGLTDRTEYYDNNNLRVKRTDYTYNLLESSEFTAMKAVVCYTNSGCFLGAGEGDFILTYYPMIGELWKPGKTTDSTFTADGRGYATSTIMNYSTDPYHLLKQQQVLKSDGSNSYSGSLILYPGDYTDATGAIGELRSRQVMDKPVETVTYINRNNSISITGGTLNTYRTGANLGQLANTYAIEAASPLALTSFRFSNQAAAGTLPGAGANSAFFLNTANYKKKMNYDAYDSHNNLFTYHKEGDMTVSMLWDYNNQYPIAEVKNADSLSIAYTSFEADGKGNWVLPAATPVTTTAVTGVKAFPLNGTITRAGLAANQYIVSYWSRNGSLSVNGAAGVAKVTINGWTCYEHVVTVNAGTVNVTGTATIDELRLYPKGAQMTTYTYEPLLGRTSDCNPANKVSYYLYDGLGRLQALKDLYGNILKTYDYHYKQ